jgi:hypothetical protein
LPGAHCPARMGIGGDWKPVSEVVGARAPKALESFRHKTAYPWLRGLINAVAIVALLVFGSYFVCAAYEAIVRREWIDVVSAAQLLAMILGVLVSRGLSLVLIDIADAQLAKH